MTAIPNSADVFVVGGGPAGLAAAIAARRQGLSVILADGAGSNGADSSIDKACGEGLMPQALKSLAALGIKIGPEDGYPFRGIQFIEAGKSASATFSDGAGIGIRRTKLHSILSQAARNAGVTLLWNCPVTGFDASSVVCAGRNVRYKYLVGADGAASRVRKLLGLEHAFKNNSRFGFRRHYDIQPWSDFVEVHWVRGCQLYVTPVGNTEIGVAVLSDEPHLRLDQALPQFPDLQRRLLGAKLTSSERGAVSPSRHLRRVIAQGAALIGEASGSVDAITGDGLALAFQQAEALAAAMKANDLREYQRAHNRIRRRPAFLADVLLGLGRYDGVRHLSLRFLAEYPSIFSQMLTLHAAGPALPGFPDPLRQTQ